VTEEKSFWRDRNTVTIVLLALALAVVAGLIVGFIITRGSPGATGTTTSPTVQPTVPGAPSTTSTTTASGPLIEIVATADTYVDADTPTEGHGVESKLLVENDPPELKQALLRFEVAGIPEGETVSQAVLRLTVERESDAVVDVHLVSGDWNSATTWEDAPELGPIVGSIQPGTAEGAVVEADVTSAVTGNGTIDLYLVTESDDSSEFGSVESGDSAPVLAVAWGGQVIAPNVGGGDTDGGGDTTASTTTTTVPVEAGGDLELEGDFAVLVGAGDIADCDNDGAGVTADIVLDVLREEPDAVVFTTGDNAYENGTEDEFAECFHPTWGQFKDRIRPAVGNHDVASEDAAGYYGYFGQAAGSPGEGYYSFDVGAWQAVVLNTVCGTAGGCDQGSDQEQWLRGVLADDDARCTVALYHHPLFSSGEHGGDDDTEDLYVALYEGGADLVVNGHDHNYERFAPQDPDGNPDPARGIRQFVVGTGGKGLDPIPDEEPNSELRSSEALGVLQLKLFDGGYEWEFLAEAGSTFTDSGSGACH
jgi:acid phosphatase type 7